MPNSGPPQVVSVPKKLIRYVSCSVSALSSELSLYPFDRKGSKLAMHIPALFVFFCFI